MRDGALHSARLLACLGDIMPKTGCWSTFFTRINNDCRCGSGCLLQALENAPSCWGTASSTDCTRSCARPVLGRAGAQASPVSKLRAHLAPCSKTRPLRSSLRLPWMEGARPLPRAPTCSNSPMVTHNRKLHGLLKPPLASHAPSGHRHQFQDEEPPTRSAPYALYCPPRALPGQALALPVRSMSSDDPKPEPRFASSSYNW